jgi:hypothetical protein
MMRFHVTQAGYDSPQRSRATRRMTVVEALERPPAKRGGHERERLDHPGEHVA